MLFGAIRLASEGHLSVESLLMALRMVFKRLERIKFVKESNIYASVWVQKPLRVMKVI